MKHDPVFRKGGSVVIAWVADRNGDLLQLEFPVDSFRGWEAGPGFTFADCIVHKARAGKVRWSREGTAPLRLAPLDEATSLPSDVHGGSDPLPASGPSPGEGPP